MQSFETLWASGPVFASGAGQKPTTDSVLLASFVNISKVHRCADLCCGAGFLSVLLAFRNPLLSVDSVEVLPEEAELCKSNMLANGFDSRSHTVCGDIRDIRTLLHAGEYDLVISNPPYFSGLDGIRSPNSTRCTARSGDGCTPGELCTAAAFLCRNGGAFALVYRPERLSELLCAMSASGIEPKRMRFIHSAPGTSPCLVLAEGRRNGKPGLEIAPPLFLRGCDGKETDEVREIYHMEAI